MKKTMKLMKMMEMSEACDVLPVAMFLGKRCMQPSFYGCWPGKADFFYNCRILLTISNTCRLYLYFKGG